MHEVTGTIYVYVFYVMILCVILLLGGMYSRFDCLLMLAEFGLFYAGMLRLTTSY